MALPSNATLGELRAELAARLGAGAQGAGATKILTNATKFLTTAQEELYWKYDDNLLRTVHEFYTSPGEIFYTYGADINSDRLIELRVLFDNIWHPVGEGIDYYHDTVADTRFYPRRYDRRVQLELWPEPDAIYLCRAEHYKTLAPFVAETDRCTVDEFLLFNLALSKGKEHYKHKDYKTYKNMIDNVLKKLKRATHGNKRYIVGKEEAAPIPRPKIVE